MPSRNKQVPSRFFSGRLARKGSRRPQERKKKMGLDVYARCGTKECAGLMSKSWGDRATAQPLFLNIANDVSLPRLSLKRAF